jgi:hypothetical protein
LSIVLTIQALEASGALVRYEPTVVRDPDPQGPRHMWLTPNIRDWCSPAGPHPDDRIGDESLASLRDQLNAFVRGDFIEHGVDIKRLWPQRTDVWEIRSYLKKPQLRLFGWFVRPKLFVGVHGAVRDDLEKTRGPKWNRAISMADQARSTMVGEIGWYDADPGNYIRNPRWPT